MVQVTISFFHLMHVCSLGGPIVGNDSVRFYFPAVATPILVILLVVLAIMYFLKTTTATALVNFVLTGIVSSHNYSERNDRSCCSIITLSNTIFQQLKVERLGIYVYIKNSSVHATINILFP